MAYAVMQLKDPPELEQLRTAFGKVPGLAKADALTLGRNACGVLAKGLDRQQAMALQSALAAQGVDTQAVVETELPELPAPKQLLTVRFTSEALLTDDVMGRTSQVPWPDILLIAAGQVRLTDFTTKDVEKMVLQTSPWDEAPTLQVVSESVTTEAQNEHLLLEILTRRTNLRYQLKADRPEAQRLFNCLGERRSKNAPMNLSLFIQELAKFAPRAILNQGASELSQARGPSFTYPSKTAFYREITWLQWSVSAGKLSG